MFFDYHTSNHLVPEVLTTTTENGLQLQSVVWLIAEGGDWENVKNVLFLHSEASRSLPPQLIEISFALNESLQHELHDCVLISFQVNVCADWQELKAYPDHPDPNLVAFYWRTAHVQLHHRPLHCSTSFLLQLYLCITRTIPPKVM